MTYVAYSSKSRHFDPFSGRFTPIRPQTTTPMRKGPPTSWHPGNLVGPQRPSGHCSPAPLSPMPHARPAQEVVRRHFPAGYCLTPTADLSKSKRGSIATSTPSISVCHQTGRLLRTNQTFPPHSPSPPTRGPFSRPERSTPVASGVPAGRLYAAIRVPPLSPGTEQEFSSSYEHMEGDTTARPIGRTEPVSIVWREPPRTSVSLSRSSKFANKSSLSMSPSPRAH